MGKLVLHRPPAGGIGLAVLLLSVACQQTEGFGTFKKKVAMERREAPDVILPVRRLKLEFKDETNRAAVLRQRTESNIRSLDPQMQIADDAPFILRVTVREFLQGKTKSIDTTYQLRDRAERSLAEGYAQDSNAGALIIETSSQLIDSVADRLAKVVVPLRHDTLVLLPKGRLGSLIPLAERGDWQAYLSATERLPALKDASDAYRLYAMAVAHEALGYQAASLETKVRHLRQAVRLNVAAANRNPADQLLRDSYMPLLTRPGNPPVVWVDPGDMSRWESMLLVQKWMSAPAAPAGTLDNRGILERFAAGRSDDDLLADIAGAAKVSFSLGRDEMTALRNAGVPWQIIDTMRSKAGLPKREFWIMPDSWIPRSDAKP